jgi:hypothetical protein
MAWKSWAMSPKSTNVTDASRQRFANDGEGVERNSAAFVFYRARDIRLGPSFCCGEKRRGGGVKPRIS